MTDESFEDYVSDEDYRLLLSIAEKLDEHEIDELTIENGWVLRKASKLEIDIIKSQEPEDES